MERDTRLKVQVEFVRLAKPARYVPPYFVIFFCKQALTKSCAARVGFSFSAACTVRLIFNIYSGSFKPSSSKCLHQLHFICLKVNRSRTLAESLVATSQCCVYTILAMETNSIVTALTSSPPANFLFMPSK